jgi:hypothetical protein
MAGPRGAVITSVKSTRVVAARRLASRAFRARQRLFLAEGPQAVREAAAEQDLLSELFATPEAAERHPEIVDAAYASGATITIATDEVVDSLGDTVAGQGLVGVCRFLDQPLAAVLERPARLIVLLAHIRDPGNAGSVLRAADAAGADAVLFSSESVDVYNPKVVRTSVGSLFHRPAAGRRRPQAARRPGARRRRLRPGGSRRRGRQRRPRVAHLLDVRQRGLGTARADPRPGRRDRARSDPRPRRVAQSGHRRRRLPLRLGPRPTAPISVIFLTRVGRPDISSLHLDH